MEIFSSPFSINYCWIYPPNKYPKSYVLPASEFDGYIVQNFILWRLIHLCPERIDDSIINTILLNNAFAKKPIIIFVPTCPRAICAKHGVRGGLWGVVGVVERQPTGVLEEEAETINVPIGQTTYPAVTDYWRAQSLIRRRSEWG